MDGEKRVLVSIPSIGYLREMLDCCKKRGFREENYIVLTKDESIPRNIDQFYKKHPKKLEINELSTSYFTDSLPSKSRFASQYNDEQIEELSREFTNLKNTISKLSDEIQEEIVSSPNIKVIFSTSIMRDIEDCVKHYRPDVQLICDLPYEDNVEWSHISQVQIN